MSASIIVLKALAQARAEREAKKSKKGGGEDDMPELEEKSIAYKGRRWAGMAVRCCKLPEMVSWEAGPLQGQGAGYTLDDDNLERRIETVISGGRALGAVRILVLANAPMGLAERYTIGNELVQTPRKINNVLKGNSQLVAYYCLDVKNGSGNYVQSNAQIAALILMGLP